MECGFNVPKPFPSESTLKAVSMAKKGKIREDSSNWKGGRRKDKYGYIYIWNSELQKYYREHRLVVEEYIGRNLEDYEEVHHVNGIKDDNRIENLVVITKSEHTILHHKGVEIKSDKKERCNYPSCSSLTVSKYGLCTKHYKKQWRRLKDGLIDDLNDFREISRNHSEETKQYLSNIAKMQNREGGRFAKNKQ